MVIGGMDDKTTMHSWRKHLRSVRMQHRIKGLVAINRCIKALSSHVNTPLNIDQLFNKIKSHLHPFQGTPSYRYLKQAYILWNKRSIPDLSSSCPLRLVKGIPFQHSLTVTEADKKAWKLLNLVKHACSH